MGVWVIWPIWYGAHMIWGHLGSVFVDTDNFLNPIVFESVGILDSNRWHGNKGPEMIRTHIWTLIEWIEANHPSVIDINNIMLLTDNSGSLLVEYFTMNHTLRSFPVNCYRPGPSKGEKLLTRNKLVPKNPKSRDPGKIPSHSYCCCSEPMIFLRDSVMSVLNGRLGKYWSRNFRCIFKRS